LNAVLVDTSVWVDHFRNSTDALIQLPSVDQVWIHPMVLGELACGTPPSRVQTLADLERLQQIQQANHREVLMFIEKERLFGVGCGLVDITLLASTLMTPGAELWTLDKRLGDLARRFAIDYRPAIQ
jgi:predicted nucleic acid-binding protein